VSTENEGWIIRQLLRGFIHITEYDYAARKKMAERFIRSGAMDLLEQTILLRQSSVGSGVRLITYELNFAWFCCIHGCWTREFSQDNGRVGTSTCKRLFARLLSMSNLSSERNVFL